MGEGEGEADTFVRKRDRFSAKIVVRDCLEIVKFVFRSFLLEKIGKKSRRMRATEGSLPLKSTTSIFTNLLSKKQYISMIKKTASFHSSQNQLHNNNFI